MKLRSLIVPVLFICLMCGCMSTAPSVADIAQERLNVEKYLVDKYGDMGMKIDVQSIQRKAGMNEYYEFERTAISNDDVTFEITYDDVEKTYDDDYMFQKYSESLISWMQVLVDTCPECDTCFTHREDIESNTSDVFKDNIFSDFDEVKKYASQHVALCVSYTDMSSTDYDTICNGVMEIFNHYKEHTGFDIIRIYAKCGRAYMTWATTDSPEEIKSSCKTYSNLLNRK